MQPRYTYSGGNTGSWLPRTAAGHHTLHWAAHSLHCRAAAHRASMQREHGLHDTIQGDIRELQQPCAATCRFKEPHLGVIQFACSPVV